MSANGLVDVQSTRPWGGTPFEAEYRRLHEEIARLKGQSPVAQAVEHDPKRCAASGQNCVWPDCVYERAKLAAVRNGLLSVKPEDVLSAAQFVLPAGPLKLDLGCGNTTRRALSGLKEKGFTGVDLPGTEGADVHCDLSKDTWPWPDNSVDEVNCAHMVEHIPAKDVEWALESSPACVTVSYSGYLPPVTRLVKKVSYPRVHFFNELYRTLKPRAKATIITPHWCSCRAYGDVTHEWPPVSEMFWQYLDKPWREVNAPHVGFTCDFEVGYGYLTAAWLQAEVANRNPEYVQKITTEAIQKYKEAAQDMHATLTARK